MSPEEQKIVDEAREIVAKYNAQLTELKESDADYRTTYTARDLHQTSDEQYHKATMRYRKAWDEYHIPRDHEVYEKLDAVTKMLMQRLTPQPRQTTIMTIQRMMHIHEHNGIQPSAVNQLGFSALTVPLKDNDEIYEWLHANIHPFQEGFNTWKFAEGKHHDWKHAGYSMWKRLIVKRDSTRSITGEIFVIFNTLTINVE